MNELNIALVAVGGIVLLEYDVGIGYGDDVEEAKRLMLEAIHSVNEVLRDPAPDVLVLELTEYQRFEQAVRRHSSLKKR